jgi:hypothetical protein
MVQMTYEEIKAENAYVMARFRYTYDPIVDGVDEWHSSANKLATDPIFIIKDDCDGLSMTVAHHLRSKGHWAIWRLMVSSTDNGQIDHMVAMVQLDNGEYWIVGDTGSSVPVRAERCPYGFIQFNDIDHGLAWQNWTGKYPVKIPKK